MTRERAFHHSLLILRLGLCAVFAWFGLEKLLIPETTIATMTALELAPIDPALFTTIMGLVEVAIAILLLLGLFTRIIAGIGALMIAGIFMSFVFMMGVYFIRDAGLFATAIFLAINGAGDISLDFKVFGKKTKAHHLKKAAPEEEPKSDEPKSEEPAGAEASEE